MGNKITIDAFFRRKAMVKCLYATDPRNLFTVEGAIGKRDKFDLEENETSSVTDMIFGDLRKQRATKSMVESLKDKTFLIQESEEMIETHIDKRIALFFQELIVCYDVPFFFEIGETQHQAPSAPTLAKKAGGEEVKVPFNSAHSSTIPCLYAYPRKEWVEWGKNPEGKEKPKPFVYLKGSHVYNSQNATIEMIKLVNSADISLDGTRHSADQLRTKSIDLINKTAKGVLTPQMAFLAFLKETKQILESKVKSSDVKPEIRAILDIYLERIEAALTEAENGSYLDQLLDVRIDGEKREAGQLRSILYKRRFDIIRRSVEKQSVIAKRIEEVSAKILGIDRRPPNFRKALKQKVFALATSANEKKTLAKLFNVSQEQLKKDLEGKRTTSANKLINDPRFKGDFDNLMREIRKECRELVKEEFAFRAQVTRDLRQFKGWRQVDLAESYKSKFKLSISQPTISRLENTIKLVDGAIAHRLAELFEVDPGIFFPALFTSA